MEKMSVGFNRWRDSHEIIIGMGATSGPPRHCWWSGPICMRPGHCDQDLHATACTGGSHASHENWDFSLGNPPTYKGVCHDCDFHYFLKNLYHLKVDGCNYIPKYLVKRTVNSPHKNLSVSVHSSIIPKSQKMESHMYFNGSVAQQSSVCPHNGLLCSHRTVVLTHATMWMNLENTELSERARHKRLHV